MPRETSTHWLPPSPDYRAPDADGHTAKVITFDDLSKEILSIIIERDLHFGKLSSEFYRDRIVTQLHNNIADANTLSEDLIERTIRSDEMQFVDFTKIGPLYYKIYRDAVMRLTLD